MRLEAVHPKPVGHRPHAPRKRPLSYVDPAADQSLRRRAGPLALTIAAHLLLLLLLLRLAPDILRKPPVAAGPLTVSLLPNEADDTPRAASKAKTRSSAAARRASAVPNPKPPPTPAEIPPELPHEPTGMIYMSRADMAQADISKMPSRAGQAASGEGTGTDVADSGEGAGRGPAGQKLYNAEWYRQPTDAELSFYLKPSMPRVGVALIACQTVARFHVDNCVSLGESPPGSGLSRAMVDAAWQFLVRPPRVGGRQMVGEWVRIEIEFTTGGARSGRGSRG